MRKRTEETRERKSLMDEFCDQAGCTDRQRANHVWKWEHKRWHAHPSPDFLNWWEPHDFDSVSGASSGGHPEARRQWARKDADGWKRGWYGVSTIDAWNTAEYVQQFDAWQGAGSPEREPFISISATLEKQKQFWRDLKPAVANIGKKMPKINKGDAALEAFVTPTMPNP